MQYTSSNYKYSSASANPQYQANGTGANTAKAAEWINTTMSSRTVSAAADVAIIFIHQCHRFSGTQESILHHGCRQDKNFDMFMEQLSQIF